MSGSSSDESEVTTPKPRFSNTISSGLDPKSSKGSLKSVGMEALLKVLAQQEDEIRQGGGAKAIDAQHGKKRLTARERLELLLDPGEEFLELGPFAAFGTYAGGRGGAAA